MKLPLPLSDLLAPLFEALPLESAMPELVPQHAGNVVLADQLNGILANPLIQQSPALQAGLWLYIDDLNRSHEISQGILTPVGSLWHGIMHRREGDFWNSKYWFGRAGKTEIFKGVDPSAFVDRVEKAYRSNPPELIKYQRQEWQTLFEWCAKEAFEGAKE